MIRGRRKRRREDVRELEAAKLRTSASRLRAQREYRKSGHRLEESRQVARALAVRNDSDYADIVRALFNGSGAGS